jgi:hypothetical protein
MHILPKYITNSILRIAVLSAAFAVIGVNTQAQIRCLTYTTITQPGGVVDSALGAQIMNAICTQAPVKLLRDLEKAANTVPKHTKA